MPFSVRSLKGGSGAKEILQCTEDFKVHRSRREEEVETHKTTCNKEGRMISALLDDQVECGNCRKTFRRQGDLNRYKCLDERNKPVGEQYSSVQCTFWYPWFKSAGGLVVQRKMHGILS